MENPCDELFGEPLAAYRHTLNWQHAENTSDCFEEMVIRSGVDERRNEKLNQDRTLFLSALNEAKGWMRGWRFLYISTLVLGAGALLAALWRTLDDESALDPNLAAGLGIIGIVLLLVALVFLRKKVDFYREKMRKFENWAQKKEQEMWDQMLPLNSLLSWNLPLDLIHKTVPLIHFDPYFSEGRVRELVEEFGWDDDTGDTTRSIIFSQSGEVNGNPFVLTEAKRFKWGEKTYTGHLNITWTERVTDSEGHRRSIVRHQVLTASVRKPFPLFTPQKFLVYGNDAAPNLLFSRFPSGLSEDTESFWGRTRTRRKIKELRAFSRNLTDDSNFTLMANEEFEALFNAVDRSDEVEFRLLFTPLAQQQMLNLMKDQTVGYGDDFGFVKGGKINVIIPEHFNGFNINTNPYNLWNFHLKSLRKTFNHYNNTYFKALFFAFAPLFAIPLYRHIKSRRTIYGSVSDLRPGSWEQESIANFYGQKCFRRGDFDSDVIYKSHLSPVENRSDLSRMTITAHGFRAHQRIDYVPVFGGDGRIHNVPVRWDEYLPLQREADCYLMRESLAEGEASRNGFTDRNCGWQERLSSWTSTPSDLLSRRSFLLFR